MEIPGAAAFDVFNDIRGMVIFYLFILEEAAQTAGMACYMCYKDNRTTQAAEHAQWIKDNITTNGRTFAQTIGLVAYPMNDAFITYFDAADKANDYYATHEPGQ
jgi:hypothetical protein